MKQNVIIALAVISTLVAGYALFSHGGSQNDTSTVSNDLRAIYNQWKAKHNVKVGSYEDDYRFGVFAANYELIQKHNADPKATSRFALNRFTHLTADEFSALHFGLNYTKPLLSAAAKTLKTSIEKIEGIPDEWDWEKQGKLTPVINQGQCGSSYAFPAINAIESLIAINGGELKRLSVQQIIDCAGAAYQSIGCSCGGLPAGVFEYVRDNGVVSEADYPYKAEDGTCNIPAGAARVKINSYLNVTANSEEALRAAVYKNPVASGVDGTGLQYYESGILGTDKCTSYPGHGVLIVGYGTEGNTPYWKVKNLWGADWGENGYFRIERLEGPGACGINVMDNYPTN